MIPHPSQDTVPHHNRSVRDAEIRQHLATMSPSDEAVSHHSILQERPEHITIAYLMAAGRTRSEISKITGYAVATLSQLVRQPWFKTRLKEITESVGTDMVKAFLQGEVLPSLEVLRNVRDNPDERGATRVAAANSILDRFMGKPTVHVESQTNLNIHSAADAKDQVQSELEKVDAELRWLGVSSSNPRAN